MARVIAYDDAKVNQRIVGGKYKKNVSNVQTPFFGGKDTPNLPLITMRGFGAGRYSPPHFHDVNQFQIMVGGKGKLGRRDIKANTVHFSRAYTPYGPLVADDKEGLECLIIRERLDTGAFHSPEDLASLSKMPDRHPWQITRDAVFPALGSSGASLQPVPEMQDDRGFATYALCVAPGATALTPDPATGNGLFIVVFKGSLIHEGKESKALTVVYVSNKEPKFEIRAGSEGLKGLIVQFPQAIPTADRAKDATSPLGSKSWHCSLCSFVYDEKVGLPGDGIAPGTRWEDVPETWTCPDCTASKADFKSGKS